MSLNFPWNVRIHLQESMCTNNNLCFYFSLAVKNVGRFEDPFMAHAEMHKWWTQSLPFSKESFPIMHLNLADAEVEVK